MKKYLSTAAVSLLAACALLPAAAQTVQQGLHLKQVNPCFASSDPVEQYLARETDQKLLFTASAMLMILAENREIPQQAMLAVFLGPNSSQFTVLAIFRDGTTCLVTEGMDFEPYTGRN